MKNGKISGLYVILDPSFLEGISEVEAAEAMIRGGARVIQWRDKTRDKGEQLPIVKEVNRICAAAGVTSIVNDHVDLALASGADGVHLGQKDLPLVEARALMPEGAVIGVSTATVEEAKKGRGRRSVLHSGRGDIPDYVQGGDTARRPCDAGGGVRCRVDSGGSDWGYQRRQRGARSGSGRGLGMRDQRGLIGYGY